MELWKAAENGRSSKDGPDAPVRMRNQVLISSIGGSISLGDSLREQGPE
jgi:hypothetical protein